jgi:hypothetical protein
MAENTDDYAVVVGVSHYEGLQVLKGPDRDAQDFFNWAIDPTGGKLPTANAHLVLSTEIPLLPIQDDIDKKFGTILKTLRDQNRSGRRLYFYFSGHGLGIEWNETALVLPPWTDIMRNYALSSSKYLTTLIHSGRFTEVFFFLDCCRNRMVGVNGATPFFGNAKPAAGAVGCSWYGFSATEFDNKAFEALIQPGDGSLLDNDRTRGLFTVSLINGLKGAAADGGRVTTTSLKDYIKLNLPEIAGAQNKTQIPRFHTDDDGNESIIVDGLPSTDVLLQIKFKAAGRTVILENAKLKVLKEGSSDDEEWQIDLPKGLYAIYYKDDKQSEKAIRVDGSVNPFIFEF